MDSRSPQMCQKERKENNGQAGASKIQGTVSRMMTQSQINKARDLAEAAGENRYLDV